MSLDGVGGDALNLFCVVTSEEVRSSKAVYVHMNFLHIDKIPISREFSNSRIAKTALDSRLSHLKTRNRIACLE